MEFSDTYKHTGPCCFSPDARYLAIAVDYRLVIRDVVTLKLLCQTTLYAKRPSVTMQEVVQLYSCMDKISNIEWALDSEYILCSLYKRAMVQAWSLSQPEWTCKIDEGPAGIAHARWSPDSRHIITTSDFQLRLTVWSLVNTACIHIQWPKHASKGVSFTQDGKFAAIATRRDCKDYVNLLSCHTWEVMGTFTVDTIDLADLEWSPNDSAIVVWDSPLDYKVLIYSPDGRCLFKYQAYESGLGVKTVAWSPCSQFLAVGSYDQTLRALNHLTWKPFAEFVHVNTVRGPASAVVFKEVEEPWHLDMSGLHLNDDSPHDIQDGKPENAAEGHSRVRYKVVEFPVNLSSQKHPLDKPNPKQGIGLLAWSRDSQYLVTRNDNMPTALWIWDICRLELAALLIQKEPIRAAAWDPVYPRVALCTGSSHLYMWTPSGACCVNIPLPQFVVSDLKWNPDGTSMLLKDRESFCCTFVPLLPEFNDDENSEE